jgi:hypothetical protein
LACPACARVERHAVRRHPRPSVRLVRPSHP